jgi:FkbM family methyltransferase
VGGYESTQGSLFNRYDGRTFFPRSRSLTFMHVGAAGGALIDRYGALGRGPRLDDHLVMVEPNPLTAERLGRRLRMDQRLLLSHKAAWDEDGVAWLEYDKPPNSAGASGKLRRALPDANLTELAALGKGSVVQTTKLDTLLSKFEGPIDFILMDADGHEPFILKGAAATLKRTRAMIFSCNSQWTKSGANMDVLTAAREIFAPAGLEVALMGGRRNILLNTAVVPDDFAASLPDWSFCIAMHVAPPLVRKTSEIVRFLAGSDAIDTACGQFVQSLSASSCENGLLNTLHGLDTAAQPLGYDLPFY